MAEPSATPAHFSFLVDAAGKVDAVAVGADRVAANGDTANKIGTLQLAIAAAHYAIPFLVVAPVTSCDPQVCVSLMLRKNILLKGVDWAVPCTLPAVG